METLIGRPLDRVDGRLKVTGRAVYAYEQRVPNTAYAVLVTSGIAKGTITSIDTQAAEHAPGVLLVMTHLNSPKLPTLRSQSKKPPAGRVVQVLQDNVVRYANQPIALVVADTLENANEGARLVNPGYAAETPQVDLDTRLNQAFTLGKAGGGGDAPSSSRGDLTAGLAAADARVQQVYRTPFEVHNPMEPHATIAVWDAPDHLTLYDATQGISSDQKRLAELFEMKPENVRVISPFLGGGFGSKGPIWSNTVLAAMAARQVNRPVKLAITRPQMFGMVGCRSETRQALHLGAKKDGTLTALEHVTHCHTSTFDDFTETASLPARMLYSTANNKTAHYLVRSDIGQPSWMRAPGEAPGTFALESAIDEMAYAVSMDPIEFRLKNYAASDEQEKKPWSSKSLSECYKQGAERFGWSRRTMPPRSMRQGSTLVGWGMASAVYPAHRMASSALARLNADATVSVDSGTQDLGTGTYTSMTLIAAESLGVAPGRVKFRLGDTKLPPASVSGGSMTTASTGSAVYLASQALREKLIQLAVTSPGSPLAGAGAQDVVLEGGSLSLASDRSRTISFQDLVRRSGQPHIETTADAKPGAERDQYSMYAFGAQFAEVHVDAELGQITVPRMLGCFGAGKILSTKTARSQFLGGMIWGLSMALEEHAAVDKRLGRWVNNNLAEYHVPVNADIGEVEAIWVDEKDDHINPIGAKGIGEIGITGAAAAVTNAIFHATGKRFRNLPVTPDQLLA